VLLVLSLAAVFHRLAAPLRLGDWLPDVVAVKCDADWSSGTGTAFSVRLRQDGREVPGTGEVIAYEPPWSLAYRLVAGPRTHVLRLACVSVGGATRVSVHQANAVVPLRVDLGPLAQI
jgi:hypothetical protein